MSMKLIDTYSEGDYNEIEVFECCDCGRTFTIQSGGDIACCPCEFEREAEYEAELAINERESEGD